MDYRIVTPLTHSARTARPATKGANGNQRWRGNVDWHSYAKYPVAFNLSILWVQSDIHPMTTTPMISARMIAQLGRWWIMRQYRKGDAEDRAGEAARPGAISGRDGTTQATPQAAGKSGLGWRMAAAGVVLMAAGGGWLTWSLYRGTAPHYVTQKIERGSVVVTASGIVSPMATTPLLARVSGLIQALYCDANMKVQAGQLCAKIDPGPYQTVVDQDKADLAAVEARLEKDKVDLARASMRPWRSDGPFPVKRRSDRARRMSRRWPGYLWHVAHCSPSKMWGDGNGNGHAALWVRFACHCRNCATRNLPAQLMMAALA
jgi:hypothetical protein